MKLARRLDRRAALRNSRRSAVKEQIRRALRAERLEDRSLLAGDLGSDYYNAAYPTDVDNDGYTAPGDALTIINALNSHGPIELPEAADGEDGSTMFVDVDNDGHLSPSDALTVINWLNAEGEPPVPDANDIVQYHFKAVKPGSDPSDPANEITTIQNGADFDLVIEVRDLREDGDPNRGLFAAYTELTFDNARAAPRVAEIQQITLGNTASTFTLTIPAFGTNPGGTTAPISYSGNPTNATTRRNVANSIQAAMNATLGANTVLVSPIETSGFNFSVWFVGAFDVNVPKMSSTVTAGPGPATIRDASDNTAQSSFINVDGDISIPNSFVEAFRSRDLNLANGLPGPYQEKGSAQNKLDPIGGGPDLNLVDELGFFTSSLSPLGNFPFEVVHVRMKAMLPAGASTGSVTFTPYFGEPGVPEGDASENHDSIDRPAHNTLVYANADETPPENQFVDPGQIAFNTLVLQISSGPIASGSFTVNTTEDIQDLQINVLAEVDDNPGDPVNPQIELVGIGTASTGGSVTIDTKGTTTKTDDTVVFDAAVDFNGNVTFTYTAQVVGNTDPNQQSTATVTVAVAAINDAPTISAIGTQTINEDAPTTVQLTGIGPGDGTAEAGQTLTVTAVATTNPSLIGAITVNYTTGATGSLQFTPAANASGTATISVTVKDDGGTVGAGSDDSTTVTFDVVVNALNDAPENRIGGVAITGSNNSVIAPGATFTFTGATQLSVNDPDAAGADLTTVLSLPAGQGTLDVATAGTTDVGTPGGVTIAGDRTNSVTLTGTQAEINAALTSVVYTPGAGFSAILTMATTDNLNATTTSTINISRDPGVRPFAVDDSLSIPEGTTGAQPIDVLGNDFKLATATTTVVAVGSPTPAQGSVAFTASGVTYTPPGGDFFGTVTFTYTIDDDDATTTATLDERTGTVVVTITPVNDKPDAVNDSYQAAIGSTLVVTANGTPKGLLFNDTDADGDTLTAVNAVILPGQGTVVLSPDGGFTYTPPSGGDFTFTYQARDPSGEFDTATVSIHVVAPPTANPDDYTATEDVLFTSPTSVLADDTDTEPGAPALTAELVAGSFTGPGTLNLNPNGTFTWTPPTNPAHFNTTRPDLPPISFQYRASSGGRVSAPALVTIEVNEVNDPPTANDDTFQAVRRQGAGGAEIGVNQLILVKANDNADPDGNETLTVTGVALTAAGPFTASVAIPNGGTARVVNGEVRYDSPSTIPATNPEFFYQLSDGRGGNETDTAKVTVTVVDFVPKTISGTVYVDSNNNGIFESTETAIGGVDLTLTGTAFDGSPVSLTATTNLNGRYVFPQAAGQPGVEDTSTFLKPPDEDGYIVEQEQVWALLSGLDTDNSTNNFDHDSNASTPAIHLVTNNDRDDNQFLINWEVADSTGDINGLNFGEIGVDLRPVNQGGALANAGGFKQEFLASSGHNGFIVAMTLVDSEPIWSFTLDDSTDFGTAWENAASISCDLSSDLTTLHLTVVDLAGTTHEVDLLQSYSIPGSTARFRVLATGTAGQYIIRIDASANGDGNPSNGLEDGVGFELLAAVQTVEAPAGEAPVNQQYAEAADAVFSQREWA